MYRCSVSQSPGCRRTLADSESKTCLGSYLYYTRALANVSKLGKESLCLVGVENRPLKSKSKSIIRLEILRVSARVFSRIPILCPCDRNYHDVSNFDSREKKNYHSNCLFLLFYRTFKFKACFLGHCFFLWSILFCRCKA